MFEKVNPSHPDKIADRIAGAIIDLAYKKIKPLSPRIAVEVLIGHGDCTVICESNTTITRTEVDGIVNRIAGKTRVHYTWVPQDNKLADNQRITYCCGDNGIFKGCVPNDEEQFLSELARELYSKYPYDGKYLIDDNKLVICQSNAEDTEVREFIQTKYKHWLFDRNLIVNPLGYWTGGLDVDSGATNRKLGSDMGRAITGGGLHGKDLTKADVTLNIHCHLITKTNKEHEHTCSCAIGDDYVDNTWYRMLMSEAESYVKSIGGFEKLAEWGLV